MDVYTNEKNDVSSLECFYDDERTLRDALDTYETSQESRDVLSQRLRNVMKSIGWYEKKIGASFRQGRETMRLALIDAHGDAHHGPDGWPLATSPSGK